MAQPDESKPREILCPYCGAMTTWQGNPWRPFCSERCKMSDLGAWADEKYSIPSEDAPGTGEDEGG